MKKSEESNIAVNMMIRMVVVWGILIFAPIFFPIANEDLRYFIKVAQVIWSVMTVILGIWTTIDSIKRRKYNEINKIRIVRS